MEEPGLKFILGKPLRGWLRRQGGKIRGWQRRYFVLKENCLFCFHREDDTRVTHTYLLDDLQLKDVPTNPDDPDKFAFELVAEKSHGEAVNVVLCAASDQEKKEWTKALCYHIYSGRGGAIFGTALEVTMKHQHKAGRSVPYIVSATIDHLDKFAMETEGIFRLAGRAGLLRELKEKFETGQRPPLEEVDVHTVGSLLKAFLRDLPESLVTPNLYQRTMNCAMRYADAKTDAARAGEVTLLTSLLQELPDVNYATLAYICRFLHRLADNAAKTKMDAHNLSLVFGPNLIRHLDNNPELLMLTADLNQHLVFMLIQHCSQVLPVRAEVEAVPAAGHQRDSPRLRRKNTGPAPVATADLLRLSRPVDTNDPSLLTPRPTAMRDLMGLDLNLVSEEPGLVDRSLSTPSTTPSSPFEFVNDHFEGSSHPGGGGEGGGEGAPLPRPLASVRRSVKTLDRNSKLGELQPRPVAPKRTKSSKHRSRPLGGGPPSPASPDASRTLVSHDILQALASVNNNNADSPAASGGVSSSGASSQDAHKLRGGDGGGGEGTAGECGGNKSPSTEGHNKALRAGRGGDRCPTGQQQRAAAADIASGCGSGVGGSDRRVGVVFADEGGGGGKVGGVSRAELEAQNSALKAELVSSKDGVSRAELEVQNSALKAELVSSKDGVSRAELEAQNSALKAELVSSKGGVSRADLEAQNSALKAELVSSNVGGVVSKAELEAQNSALKAELVSSKARSDTLVGALKNQLTEMRSKYEARISSMEQQRGAQVKDLTAKLNAERTACSTAVARTVTLQGQLSRYKMTYGDLKETL